MDKQEWLSRYDILRTEYIKLLNDKDVLENWGIPQLTALYASRVGGLQIEELQVALQVKALKRTLEILRRHILFGLPYDEAAVDREVQEELLILKTQILQKTQELASAKKFLATLDSPQKSAELRQIFRLLAKQLHPDVNTNLSDEQIFIWHQVKQAYQHGDTNRLKALQIAYEKEISGTDDLIELLTEEQLELKCQVMAEGIKVLAKEIENIRNEFPFTIEENIKNDEWVSKTNEATQQKIDALRALEGELILEYQALKNGYGGSKPELN